MPGGLCTRWAFPDGEWGAGEGSSLRGATCRVLASSSTPPRPSPSPAGALHDTGLFPCRRVRVALPHISLAPPIPASLASPSPPAAALSSRTPSSCDSGAHPVLPGAEPSAGLVLITAVSAGSPHAAGAHGQSRNPRHPERSLPGSYVETGRPSRTGGRTRSRRGRSEVTGPL